MAMNKAERNRLEELERALAGATVNQEWYEEPRPMTREEIEAAKVEVTPKDRSIHKTRMVALGWGFNDYMNGVIVFRVPKSPGVC